MARKKHKQHAKQNEPIGSAVNDVVEQAHASTGEKTKKKWVPAPNPHGIENIKGEGNRVRLLKSEFKNDRGETLVAWVIRFEKPPNQMHGYSKGNPHPVLRYLKSEGFNWNFDRNDDMGGHGKISGVVARGKVVEGDPYGSAHIEARRVLHKAAEMVGAKIEKGQEPTPS